LKYLKKYIQISVILILINNTADLFSQSFDNVNNISATVSFQTEDSIWVFADLYNIGGSEAIQKNAPVILLLHQAASNSEEYKPVIPHLLALGFNCLAVDARGGGNNYGRHNRTNANLPNHGGGKEAYWDFKAALKYLDENSYVGNRTIWGSSYSAGRMFQILKDKPNKVVAGISFSPGRAFARKGETGELAWAEEVEIPIFMTWAPNELDDEKRERFSKITSKEKILYVQENGVHGSSAVRPDKNPEGYKKILEAVLDFLNKYSR